MMEIVKKHWPIAAILVVFFGLGSAYSIITPLFESPDEVWHYEYVRWLVEGHGLPTPEEVGTAPWHQEGSQPPLYYLTAALVTGDIPTDNASEVIRYNPHAAVGQADASGNKNVIVHGRSHAWPWQGVVLAAHLARFLSLLISMVTVLSTYGTALVIFPGQQRVAALAASLVAFNPQFLFISASVSNNCLVTASCAAGVWLSCHLLGKYARTRQASSSARDTVQSVRSASLRGPAVRELVLLGILVGIAALAQLSGIALAGVAGLTLLLIAWRLGAPVRMLLGWLAVVGTAVLVVAGWWYGRNVWLYHDPLGLSAMFDVLPRRAAPPTLAELVGRAQGVWRSMWAVFGWFNIVTSDWLYAIYGALSLAGLVGLVVVWPVCRLARRGDRDMHVSAGGNPFALQVGLLVIWIVIIGIAVLAWAQMRYPQGRLLFPAIGAMAILLAIGIANVLPKKLQPALGVVLPTGLCALAILAPLKWIAPAYAAPALLSATVELPNPSSVDFGDQVRLVGYEIAQAQVQPGGTLDLTLYWQAVNPPTADYSIFVHLVDEYGILQAQHDSYPATGSLPTTGWPLSKIIPDEHPVRIPDTAYQSLNLAIVIGVYDYDTGTRLPVGGRDKWKIGEVEILPRVSADGIRNPVRISFDDQIALVGFDFDRRVMQPGEILGLTLWWEALAIPESDYVVFTHLVYPPDAVWAGQDQMLQAGAARTSNWRPGEQVSDRYELMLPAEAPQSVYFVEIGLLDPATGDRLMVDGSDKGIVLGYIKVE